MPSPKSRPNPFYVALVLLSTAFTITAFAYLIGPFMERRAREHPAETAAGSRAMAAWFDRNGPKALFVEFGLMTAAAVLAMLTDRWFSPAAKRGGAKLE